MKGKHRARARSWRIVWGGAALLAVLGMLGGCAGLAGLGEEGTVYRAPLAPPAGQDEPALPTRQVAVADKYGLHLVPVRPAKLPRAARPAGDAWIVVMWRYNGSVSDVCMHGVVVRTDAQGEFHAHMWVDPLNFGFTFFPWRNYHRVIVYKPGYAIADSAYFGPDPDSPDRVDIRYTADNEPVILLKPDAGGLAGRLEKLNQYLDNPTLNCSDSSLISPPSPQMAPFLLAIADEAASLARTQAERDSVEAMRFQVKLKTGLTTVNTGPARIVPMPMSATALPVIAPRAPAVTAPMAPAVMAPAQPAP